MFRKAIAHEYNSRSYVFLRKTLICRIYRFVRAVMRCSDRGGEGQWRVTGCTLLHVMTRPGSSSNTERMEVAVKAVERRCRLHLATYTERSSNPNAFVAVCARSFYLGSSWSSTKSPGVFTTKHAHSNTEVFMYTTGGCACIKIAS